jgi:hypothetical protein
LPGSIDGLLWFKWHLGRSCFDVSGTHAGVLTPVRQRSGEVGQQAVDRWRLGQKLLRSGFDMTDVLHTLDLATPGLVSH